MFLARKLPFFSGRGYKILLGKTRIEYRIDTPAVPTRTWVGVWVRAVMIMTSAPLILIWSMVLGWVVRVELLDTYTKYTT